MNGSRIASRSTPSSVSLPAQSFRATSSAGLLPAGRAATSPFAIDVASSWSAGLAVHAASATRAIVYVGFIAVLTSLREQGDQGERAGVDGERAGEGDLVDRVRRLDLRHAVQRELHNRHVRMHDERP